MKWNNLQTLPENGKHVWVLNSEYGSKYYDPLCQRRVLRLREGVFYLGSGWDLGIGWDLGRDLIANVMFWTDPTPLDELPEVWPSGMPGDNCNLKYMVDRAKQE